MDSVFRWSLFVVALQLQFSLQCPADSALRQRQERSPGMTSHSHKHAINIASGRDGSAEQVTHHKVSVHGDAAEKRHLELLRHRSRRGAARRAKQRQLNLQVPQLRALKKQSKH